MSHKYDGRFMQSLWDAVERAENRFKRLMGRPGGDAGNFPPEGHGEPISQPGELWRDYSAEFDQSRHAVSIEESRERSVGCWDRPDEPGE